MQKLFREAHGPERDADRLLDALVFRERNFAASAADVDKQAAPGHAGLIAHDAAMDQPAFFEAGDDLDVPSGFIAHPGEEGAGVARIAHGGGGDGADLVRSVQLRGAIKALQRFERGGHGFGGDQAGFEYAAAETRDFAVFMQDFELVLDDAGNFEPAGIGTYVDGGKRLHARGCVLWKFSGLPRKIHESNYRVMHKE